MTDPRPFSLSRHIRRYGIWWAVLLFVAILAGGFALGYRVGPGLSIVKAGTLVLTDLPESTSIYVDTKLRATVKSGGEYRTRLVPGVHTIIVDSEGRTPWQDAVVIVGSEETVKEPLLLATRPDGAVLRAEERARAIQAIDAQRIPTIATALTVGCTDIYVAQNRIMGRAVPGCENTPDYLCEAGDCTAPTMLLAPIETITSLIAYPGRNDTLLFTIGDFVYALDIDPRDPRFFAPFIRTSMPRVGLGEEGTLLLKDEDNAYSFTL